QSVDGKPRKQTIAQTRHGRKSHGGNAATGALHDSLVVFLESDELKVTVVLAIPGFPGTAVPDPIKTRALGANRSNRELAQNHSDCKNSQHPKAHEASYLSPRAWTARL